MKLRGLGEQIMPSKRDVDRSELQIFAACPVTGVNVATHALMTAFKFRSYSRALAVFCPLCDKAHLFSRAELQLTSMGHLPQGSRDLSRQLYSLDQLGDSSRLRLGEDV